MSILAEKFATIKAQVVPGPGKPKKGEVVIMGQGPIVSDPNLTETEVRQTEQAFRGMLEKKRQIAAKGGMQGWLAGQSAKILQRDIDEFSRLRGTKQASLSHDLENAEKVAFWGGLSEAPNDYVKDVSSRSGIPEEHVRSYVRNIRPHRFMVDPKTFAEDLKPVWGVKEKKYNPLQQGLMRLREGSPEEAAYLKEHKAALDQHHVDWLRGQARLRFKYTGGDTIGEWAHLNRALEAKYGPDWHGMGKGQKKEASLCEKIAGTINLSDFQRFEALYGDSGVRDLVFDNEDVTAALRGLFSEPPVPVEKLASTAVAAALSPRVDVVQIVPSGYGYRVKLSAAPNGVAPQEVQMSAPEAQQALPAEALQTADQQGVATMTGVEAEPDPLQEQVQPVTGFGLYKVFEAGTGRQIVGYVIPGLFDPASGPTPMSLFVNGGQYALQPQIDGVLVGLNFNLPEGPSVRGLGIFYKTDGKALHATVPYTVISEISVTGPDGLPQKYYAAQDPSGAEVQLVVSEGILRPTLSGQPGEILIPPDYRFLPLDNPIQLEGGSGQDPMMTRQASAHDTMMELRAWEGGCDLRGPVFDKLGSGEHDWVDGLFWMAAAGVPQNLGVSLLEKAASSGAPVRIFGLRHLTPVRDAAEEAVEKAASDLAAMPPLPCRLRPQQPSRPHRA